MYLGEGGTEPKMTRGDGLGGDSADEAANAARLALIASHGKPQRERELLRAIYNAGEYASVEHGDSPDFLLRHHHVNSRFGVEVTEVFDSDADARLRFHPDYVTRLLAGGRHMHRDDVDVLRRTKVMIQAADGTVKHEGVTAIIREVASPARRNAAITARLRRKDGQVRRYPKDLSHVNLIIGDRFPIITDVGSDSTYSVSDLLAPELRTALLQSRFREVFLVQARSNGTRTYRPLQQLLLVETFFLFCGACAAFPSAADGGADFLIPDIVPLFVHAQRHSGMEVTVGSAGSDLCAVYRGAGARLDDGGMKILDSHDFPPPAAVPASPLRFAPEVLADLKGHFEAFKNANRFSTAIWYDAGKDDDA
jgi:hypothetical protein